MINDRLIIIPQYICGVLQQGFYCNAGSDYDSYETLDKYRDNDHRPVE
jgi:hypothetical protein